MFEIISKIASYLENVEFKLIKKIGDEVVAPFSLHALLFWG